MDVDSSSFILTYSSSHAPFYSFVFVFLFHSLPPSHLSPSFCCHIHLTSSEMFIPSSLFLHLLIFTPSLTPSPHPPPPSRVVASSSPLSSAAPHFLPPDEYCDASLTSDSDQHLLSLQINGGQMSGWKYCWDTVEHMYTQIYLMSWLPCLKLMLNGMDHRHELGWVVLPLRSNLLIKSMLPDRLI